MFFASARELAGCQAVSMSIEDDSKITGIEYTSEHMKNKLNKMFPELIFDEHKLTLIYNTVYLKRNDVVKLKDGDVIGVMPPIGGG